MSLVVCAFDGWVQVRLATNPDPTDEPRGVSGYTFALPGEPDLDRVLRTHDPIAPRTHGPPIGVFVRTVTVDGVAVATHPLVGARLDLLGEPRFESVNEVMMEQGEEPLEPFDVQLVHGAFRLQRRAFLDPSQPAATVYTVPRALLEPRRAQVNLATTILQQATGGSDPVAFRHARLLLLEADLQVATDPIQRAALGRRISELEITDPNDHRTISMEFIESRHFDLNGPTALVDPAGWLGSLDTFETFACDVVMGAWDADALSAYYTGTLALPTR
jgi:hypothetical protein